MRAFCYASGRIEFGHHLPDGALPIARGQSRKLRELISAHARHGYDGKTLLVPGVPEASGPTAAMHALGRWLDRLGSKAPAGVRVF